MLKLKLKLKNHQNIASDIISSFLWEFGGYSGQTEASRGWKKLKLIMCEGLYKVYRAAVWSVIP